MECPGKYEENETNRDGLKVTILRKKTTVLKIGICKSRPHPEISLICSHENNTQTNK
jgi:hypothetical protein